MSLYQRLSQVKRPSPSNRDTSRPTFVGIPGREVSNAFGSFYLMEETHPISWNKQDLSPDIIQENLQLLYGVGPVTERQLKDGGYQCLQDLLEHPRWAGTAETAMACIQQRDIRMMRRMGASDQHILPFFRQDDIVFLDIETTGLWSTQPLFLVGLLFKEGDRLRSRLLLARRLHEEKPLLAHLIQELNQFGVVVSYNGKRFDIPYIEARTVAHRLFYRSPHEQVDLLYHARRKFRDVLPDCRLVTIESQVLGHERLDDVPGHLIPETYYRYVRTQDGSLLEGIIRHNLDDLLAMEKMFPILMETT